MGFLKNLDKLFYPNIDKLKKRGDINNLIFALDHDSPEVRKKACQAMVELDHPNLLPSLIKEVRQFDRFHPEITEILVNRTKRRPEEFVNIVMKLAYNKFDKYDNVVRKAFDKAIGNTENMSIVAPFINLFISDNLDSEIKLNILTTIINIVGIKAIAPLIDHIIQLYCDTAYPEVKTSIIDILADTRDIRILKPLFIHSCKSSDDIKYHLINKMNVIGELAVDVLIELINNNNDEKMVTDYILFLGGLRNPKASLSFNEFMEKKGYKLEDFRSTLYKYGNLRALELTCREGFAKIGTDESVEYFYRFRQEGYKVLKDLIKGKKTRSAHNARHLFSRLVHTSSKEPWNCYLSLVDEELDELEKALNTLPIQDRFSPPILYDKQEILKAYGQLAAKSAIEMRKYSTGIIYFPISSVSFNSHSEFVSINYRRTHSDSSGAYIGYYIYKINDNGFAIHTEDEHFFRIKPLRYED
jgi:hypothetical protein